MSCHDCCVCKKSDPEFWFKYHFITDEYYDVICGDCQEKAVKNFIKAPRPTAPSDEEMRSEAYKFAANTYPFEIVRNEIDQRLMRAGAETGYLAGRRKSLDEITALKAENERLRAALGRANYWLPCGYDIKHEDEEMNKRLIEDNEFIRQALHPKESSDV